MNLNLQTRRPAAAAPRVTPPIIRLYRTAFLLVPLTCGATSFAQTTNSPPSAATTSTDSGTNVVKLAPTTVVGKLDVARNQIVPDLGASTYTIGQEQIKTIPGGENASVIQLLLRAPGVVQDAAANTGLHVRGEHANIQYRINDVLLPEGISGFGQELDTHYIESLRLITGSLPAQYGFRTAGIVDLTTKSGAFQPGGEVSLYGGSYNTIHPSFELGGSKGNFNYFVDGSYNHNDIGIENPTGSSNPVHDRTDQYKGFTYLSYVLDDTSRISAIGSASYSDFQIPNLVNFPAQAAPGGVLWNTFLPTTNFDSSTLNENQNEQNYYAVVAYQKSAGDFNMQLAGYGRYSGVHFMPDQLGDLFFNGVSSDVDRKLYSGGLQFDASYALGEHHTLRGGFTFLDESLSTHSRTGVFPVDNPEPTLMNPIGSPFYINDNSVVHSLFAGVYLQDEWKILPKVTLNYGARFDLFYSSFDKENQPSPRVNLIYQPTDSTTLHAGYSRYFTPPTTEFVQQRTLSLFELTSNQSAPGVRNDSLKTERANYYDVGASQKIIQGLQVGVDGYYKDSVNQIDDGLFGQTLIPSVFNYQDGKIYGAEITGTYTKDGFAAYANVSVVKAEGIHWASAQFLFDPVDAAYVQNHWIHLDHEQWVTGSFGLSYLFRHGLGSTRVFADALYGSGLRHDLFLSDGSKIPNGATVPAYYTINMGVEEGFKISGKEHLRARLDVVNITDNVYQLRNGTGVGVNLPQYGLRLGFFGTVTYVF